MPLMSLQPAHQMFSCGAMLPPLLTALHVSCPAEPGLGKSQRQVVGSMLHACELRPAAVFARGNLALRHMRTADDGAWPSAGGAGAHPEAGAELRQAHHTRCHRPPGQPWHSAWLISCFKGGVRWCCCLTCMLEVWSSWERAAQPATCACCSKLLVPSRSCLLVDRHALH